MSLYIIYGPFQKSHGGGDAFFVQSPEAEYKACRVGCGGRQKSIKIKAVDSQPQFTRPPGDDLLRRHAVGTQKKAEPGVGVFKAAALA